MQSIVYKNDFILPPVNEAEALRYAGSKRGVEVSQALLSEAVALLSPVLSPAVVATEIALEEKDGVLFPEDLAVSSKTLFKHAKEAEKAYLFAATVGIGADRCIRRYASVSPALSLMLSAVAAERVETLCDIFCLSLGEKTVRVSPGYADIPLMLNQDILRLLDARRRLGVTLTESLLMTPTKSVTAIVFKKTFRKDSLL